MKRNILKLFYLPMIFFILVSFIYFLSMYFILKKEFNRKILEIKQEILTEKKEELKNRVNNINSLIDLIRKTAYSTSVKELEQFLDLYIKLHSDTLYETPKLIIGKIPQNKKLEYKIFNTKFLRHKNKLYLAYLKNKNKNIYIAAISKKFIDDIVVSHLRKYLDSTIGNRYYFDISKLLTLNPGKGGNFAKIVYMPPFMKHKEGEVLSIYNPDVKGNYFRKKYFECIKHGKSCFLNYYYFNPSNKQIEEKLSYVTFNKYYKFIILSGIYESQLKKTFNIKAEKYINDITKMVFMSVIIYLIIFLFFMGVFYLFLKKIKKSLIDEYEKLKNELENKYYNDSVTNLPNRNKLIKDEKNAKSVMIIDIKNFSHINEFYGYETGDKVLNFIGESLKELYTNVYRIGDDEFAVLFEKPLSEEEISIEYHSLIFNYNSFITVTFIIGASNEKNKLLKTAEIALSYAKASNKGYMLFNKEIEKSQIEKYKKIEFLKDVLINDKIKPFYQCIVNRNREIIKYESLMRIVDAEKIYSPYYFMDYMKESELYNAFSRNMFMKVINDLKKGFIKKASINVSFEDISDEITRNMLYNYIDQKTGEKLIVEILESESINDFELVKDFIFNMKKRGVKIAIDDFGSGYSNFVVVLDLSPDYIKIDASLIQNINNSKYQDIVKMIINFSHRYGIKVIAEYVDSKEVFEKLLKLGVDEFQGYYFCEPEPLEKIVKKDKMSSKKGDNED